MAVIDAATLADLQKMRAILVEFKKFGVIEASAMIDSVEMEIKKRDRDRIPVSVREIKLVCSQPGCTRGEMSVFVRRDLDGKMVRIALCGSADINDKGGCGYSIIIDEQESGDNRAAGKDQEGAVAK